MRRLWLRQNLLCGELCLSLGGALHSNTGWTLISPGLGLPECQFTWNCDIKVSLNINNERRVAAI